VQLPLLQAFPFASTLGEVTLHLLSEVCVFIYSSHGKWACPPLLWSFPPTATLTSFPSPGCWVCAATPAFSSWLVYLQFHEQLPLPHSLQCSGHPPSLLHVFFVVIAYYSVFFLFSLGGCRSVQRATLIWPRVVCGSTVCHLAHLVVCVFPSSLGAGIWQCGSPPGFSI
jgi:hypothetical protein